MLKASASVFWLKCYFTVYVFELSLPSCLFNFRCCLSIISRVSRFWWMVFWPWRFVTHRCFAGEKKGFEVTLYTSSFDACRSTPRCRCVMLL